jgi:CO/xanthine dehydrogenase Mo-binding subunit
MTQLPKSLIDTPSLGRWIAFLAPGAIRLAVGKVEIGQGVVTALAQIAADELDVGLGRITVLSGDTDAAPDEGMTTGSQSIEVSGSSVRIVAAEVRATFLAEAARRLNCAVIDLDVLDGAFLRSGVPTGLDYWCLAGSVSLDRDVQGNLPAKQPAQHRVIGSSVPRLDLPIKLHGGGFLHDMALAGMRHARVLRQPRLDARLIQIDEAAVARMGATLYRRGNFAAVIATEEHVAVAAATAARPHWGGMQPLDPGLKEAATLFSLPAADLRFGAPETDISGARFAAAYSRPYVAHAALGPSVALAHLADAHMVVWSHTQGVYPLRRLIAELTGLGTDAVSVRHAHGAGCYGHNGADDVALDAALLAAAHPGTPIRVQWSRADEFGFEPVSTAMVVKLSAMLDDSGRPLDWTTEIWSAPHTARGNTATTLVRHALPDPPDWPLINEVPPENGGGATRNAVPLYDLPGHRILLHLVQRPPVRTSALRGLGALPNIFAIESFLDELAERAGADPLAYRLSLLSDVRGRRVLERVADMAGWSSRGAPGSGTGLGLGFGRYKNRSAYAAVAIEVVVDTEVRMRRAWCVADGGLIINPDGARNQLEGGIIQAASWTLKEQVLFDAEGIASRDWVSYPILRFSELPDITTALIEASDQPPLGMGECTIGPTAAAIGNAVAHALGARIRDLPLTRERIASSLVSAN